MDISPANGFDKQTLFVIVLLSLFLVCPLVLFVFAQPDVTPQATVPTVTVKPGLTPLALEACDNCKADAERLKVQATLAARQRATQFAEPDASSGMTLWEKLLEWASEIVFVVGLALLAVLVHFLNTQTADDG